MANSKATGRDGIGECTGRTNFAIVYNMIWRHFVAPYMKNLFKLKPKLSSKARHAKTVKEFKRLCVHDIG